VDAAVRRLRREGYLDDTGFAARYARSRIAGQRLGRHRVRAALGARGVARAAVENGLAQALGDVSEADALDAAARRFWRARSREQPPVRLRKLWSFLLRRGFPAALVTERLKALWPRYRDALEGLEPLDAGWLEDEESVTT
jgi:SOS response regulatory protein OraA/RecX